ncbi:sugar ABC transporter substrate-binding protein [Mesorhizobium soli]|uniref:Sugar ABC transporter substrate-binding protein n=2 Tax=Pseudaminobacter soli (ex Li et al. 2025) TaxID=1295366 RepID=A0A2P7S7U6_9HYPH|nr:sugar ABC transporter substrate-binding protein [Mesorhizobium soli]
MSASDSAKARRFRNTLAALTLSLVASAPALHGAMAAEYLLGPQDKVRLKIYEWRASKDTIFEWTALNDQFTVGADGTLSLPFVGEIDAAGSTPGALGTAIGNMLMTHMGLGRPPNVAVEVVQFRPFYVFGDVKNAGEFPYRPGLTVLQALSIAGGLRTREDGTGRLAREVISGRGDLSLLTLAGINLMARKARLEAELNSADEIAFPEQLTKRTQDSAATMAMEQERLIFKARQDGMKTQIQALGDLKDFLAKELQALEEQLTLYDKQIELVEKELTGVSSLVSKGLTAAPREMSLERTLAQIRSDRLAAETAVFRARQEISRADISALEVKNKYATEVSETLRETQAQMNEISRKAQTAVQMLHDSEVTTPRLLAQSRGDEAQPIYTVVRPMQDGTASEIAATETTALQPSDTLKIKIPLSTIEEDSLAILSDSSSELPARRAEATTTSTQTQ